MIWKKEHPNQATQATTITSTLETQEDSLLLHSLIDVTSPFVEQSISTTVVPQKALLVPERLRLSRICLKLWLDNVLSSIVPTVLIINKWVSSLEDLPNAVLGHVSMNSTELILKCFLSLPNNCKPSNLQLKPRRLSSTSMEVLSLLR